MLLPPPSLVQTDSARCGCADVLTVILKYALYRGRVKFYNHDSSTHFIYGFFIFLCNFASWASDIIPRNIYIVLFFLPWVPTTTRSKSRIWSGMRKNGSITTLVPAEIVSRFQDANSLIVKTLQHARVVASSFE
jgi:hypothetical protein